MKKLKLKLDDGNNYVFQTFTMTEANSMKKFYRELENEQRNLEKKKYKLDANNEYILDDLGDKIEKELSQQEMDEMDVLEMQSFNKMASVLQKSLLKNHKDFTGDEGLSRICGLIDINELKKIMQFIFFGIYLTEPEMIDATGESK